MANLISRPLWDLRRDIDQLFDLFTRGVEPSAPEEFKPRLEVLEGDTEYQLRVELPGMKPEDVEVTLDEGAITIRGEKRREEHRVVRGTEYSECSYGSFARSIQLPHGVDSAKIRAKFERGLLCITMPKTEGSHGRRIPVATELPPLSLESAGPRQAEPASWSEGAGGAEGSRAGGKEGPEEPSAEEREPVETG